MLNDPLVLILMYFVVPLWLIAGFVDWLCHRVTHIETTSGPKESVFHLLQLIEVGLALLAGLFLEINAGVIGLVIIIFFIHEATAFWDVSYAVSKRNVGPLEQHIHSFLELLPMLAIICVSALHWNQFMALFGFGPETAEFALALRSEMLPTSYLVILLASVLALAIIPYVEELLRGRRANHTY